MALIIDLKPGEKILIGEAVVTNDSQRTRLHIAGDTPIIREKDVMKEEDAVTPCKQVYFFVQAMYLSRDPKSLHEAYFNLVSEIQEAAPSTSVFFAGINEHIINDTYYRALKEAKELMKYEEELLKNATAA